MIKAIRLNNCVPYQQAEISDCKKINFIFGANGSGKSTISSFLAYVNDTAGVKNTRFVNSELEWTGEPHEQIEVYNKAFRVANLQQDMQGIFTLGSATIDDIKVLEQLKAELESLIECYGSLLSSCQKKKDEKTARDKQFKEDAWTHILKKNDADFKNAFEGLRNSKEKFVKELKKHIDGIVGCTGTITRREELLQRYKILYASKPERRDRLILDIAELLKKISNIRTDSIWDTVIVGSKDVDIAALINKLGNSSWVGQGRQYLTANSNKCPFCQQETITEDFRIKLKAFFDTEYRRKINLITTFLMDYQNFSRQLLEAIEVIIQDRDTEELNLEVFMAKTELLKATLDANIKKIEEKRNEPERKIVLDDESGLIAEIKKLLDDANARIDAYNKLIDKRDIEEVALRDDIWATCIHEADVVIKAYQRDISNIEKALTGINEKIDDKKAEIDNLKAEIEAKSKNITSVQPTIDEINRSLKAYGFTNFSIQPAEERENYYCIKRDDGTLATNTLSEGEETFLTFLYFMKKVKGAIEPARVADKKIIVLDDPISSLDSNILYIVGSIVRELSKDIRNGEGNVTQLFVLTHNVFFHKEASFINMRTSILNDVHYWIIRKNNGVAEINAYETKNPISTSYELLWQELRCNTNASLISVQNIMRRILENYFRMFGGIRDDYFIKKFESTEEQMIVRSLLYWIDDGSHSIQDDLFIDSQTDNVPRYKKVFKDLFIKSGHISHYNMMMQIDDSVDDTNTARYIGQDVSIA